MIVGHVDIECYSSLDKLHSKIEVKKSLNLCPFDKVQYESFIAEVDKIWDIYKKARSTLPPQTVPWKGKQVYEVFITLIKEQDGK